MHGYEILQFRNSSGELIPHMLIETGYGYSTQDDARDAAVKRCNQLGSMFIYRLFMR